MNTILEDVSVYDKSKRRLNTFTAVAVNVILKSKAAILCDVNNYLGDSPPMGYLVERRTRVIFVTATSIKAGGKPREVVIESRPEYALVQLSGMPGKFPVPWEHIYELAQKRHEKNLLLERQAVSKAKRSSRSQKKH